MDQRDSIPLNVSASYYLHPGTSESITGLQNQHGMSSISNAPMHFQSNPGGALTMPPLPLDTSVAGPPSGMQQSEPVRRKRGRPRKYGRDGCVSLALKPPVSNITSTQKWRGRPPGSGRKEQSYDLGGSMFSGAGTMTPHIINVNAGEDIKRKVLSMLQGRKAVVLLSAFGSISAANIRTSSSSGSITYEGHFDIVSLSGSYVNDYDAPNGPTGGLNVGFTGPDGRLIGGPVDEALIAASPVQVVLGILLPSYGAKPKTKAPDYPEASGDYDRQFGSSLTPANLQQPSQNLASMGGWQSPR